MNHLQCISRGSEEKWPNGKPMSVGNQVAMLMDGKLLCDGGMAILM